MSGSRVLTVAMIVATVALAGNGWQYADAQQHEEEKFTVAEIALKHLLAAEERYRILKADHEMLEAEHALIRWDGSASRKCVEEVFKVRRDFEGPKLRSDQTGERRQRRYCAKSKALKWMRGRDDYSDIEIKRYEHRSAKY